MGGGGSSRWGFYMRKTTTSEGFQLSASQLKKTGMLPLPDGQDNRFGMLEFSRHQEKLATIGMYVQKNSSADYLIRLKYSVSHNRGKSFDQVVEFTAEKLDRPNRFFFRCPRCDKRVGTLYLPYHSYQFACRKCHDLAYASSQDWRKPPKVLEAWYRDLREMERLFKELDKLNRKKDKIRKGQTA